MVDKADTLGGRIMTTFGAWCMRPKGADITFAHHLGLGRLDVMVNDLSRQLKPQRFSMLQLDYADIVRQATDFGIEVHFTSWVMPHVAFCTEAGDCLQQLCLDTGAHGVVLDAEEPWTQAERPEYDEAADAFDRAMAGCRFGVTGIGWASRWIAPLVMRASYSIPQLYSTSTSGLEPREYGGPLAHWGRWTQNLVPALAAYRTSARTLRAAIAEVSPTPTILLWALRHIRKSAQIQSVIRDTTGKEAKAA